MNLFLRPRSSRLEALRAGGSSKDRMDPADLGRSLLLRVEPIVATSNSFLLPLCFSGASLLGSTNPFTYTLLPPGDGRPIWASCQRATAASAARMARVLVTTSLFLRPARPLLLLFRNWSGDVLGKKKASPPVYWITPSFYFPPESRFGCGSAEGNLG